MEETGRGGGKEEGTRAVQEISRRAAGARGSAAEGINQISIQGTAAACPPGAQGVYM